MKPLRFLCLSTILTWQCFALEQPSVEPNEPSSYPERQVAAVFSPSNTDEWQAQKSFFQENGYLWIKDFFSDEQAFLLKSWAEEMNNAAQKILSTESPDPIVKTLIIVPEARNPMQVCRVEDMLTCYPDLYQFIEDTLTSYVGMLLDEPYVLFKDKLNFKWPGGGAFPPHQDFPAFSLFAPREHITAMVCIDAATQENGCLQVAQNWRETFAGCSDVNPELLHDGRAVLPYIEGGPAHGSIKPEYVEKISWLKLKTSPRDLVLISSFVPHYSEPNQSQSSRRAMFFTYNKLNEGEYRVDYYNTKRSDPQNPIFHFGTPTNARGK